MTIVNQTLVYAGGSFRVLVENSFDQEQKQLIREASIRVRERMRSQRSAILACADNRSNRDKQSASGKAINDQIDIKFFSRQQVAVARSILVLFVYGRIARLLV